MPGPKMGPRPSDFNESSLKQSPTYMKWLSLPDGEKLRYACREFIKGHEQDDERLLRRIMIARRNNIRDHETLKVARQRSTNVGSTIAVFDTTGTVQVPRNDNSERNAMMTTTTTSTHDVGSHHHLKIESMTDFMDTDDTAIAIVPNNNNNNQNTIQKVPTTKATTAASASTTVTTATTRTRRPPHTFSDAQVEQEMDVMAVEKTRSYRSWKELSDGAEFVYNQKYVKGREGHDWLLRKNIWRRMRYRRENKQLVLQHHHQTKAMTTTNGDGDGNGDPVSIHDSNTVLQTAKATTTIAVSHEMGALQPPTQRILRSTTNDIQIDNNDGTTADYSMVQIDENNDLPSCTNRVVAVANDIRNMMQPEEAIDTSITSSNAGVATTGSIIGSNNNNNARTDNTNDTTTASAAAAAVAAVAVSLADEAAVEAAVAAAESHFHRQQQQQQQQEEEESAEAAFVGMTDDDTNDIADTTSDDAAALLDGEAIAAAVAAAAAVVVAQSSSLTTTTTTTTAMLSASLDGSYIDDSNMNSLTTGRNDKNGMTNATTTTTQEDDMDSSSSQQQQQQLLLTIKEEVEDNDETDNGHCR